jgi:hypothetical protein
MRLLCFYAIDSTLYLKLTNVKTAVDKTATNCETTKNEIYVSSSVLIVFW